MTGKIYIHGQIGSFDGTDGVELKDIIMQVKAQPEATSFDVLISSPGGVVDVGFDIYDYLKSLDVPIHTIGSGLVASIATVIFMAGTKRTLKPSTDFLIHLPSGGVEGTAEDIKAYQKEVEATEKRIIDFYKKTTGLTDSEIIPLLRYETILKHDEAFKLGFATEQPQERKILAFIKNSNLNNRNEMSKKQSLFSRFKKVFDITNKVIYDASNEAIDFPELEDDETPKVGDRATVNGEPANGEYIIPDADDPNETETYVFENGELIEIKANETEDNTDEIIEVLEAFANKIESLEARIVAIAKKNEEQEKTITAIRKAEGRQPQKQQANGKPKIEKAETGFSAAITNLVNKKKNGI